MSMQTYFMLVMSLFVIDMKLLTLCDSVSIEFSIRIIASAVVSKFLKLEQSEKERSKQLL